MDVRAAEPADRGFIDATYAAIVFAPRGPDDEMLDAEHEGERVGLGRLVPVAPDAVELGGIWTDERHRRLGIAAAVVRALLARADGRRVYCIPFAPLEGYYKRFGFIDAPPGEVLPAPITAKLAMCRVTYSESVVLLRMP
jgi:predicted N-acetyltransferase YhbS